MNDYTWNDEGEIDDFASELEVRLAVLTPPSSSFVPRELSGDEVASAARLAKQLGQKRRIRRIATQVIWAVTLLALAFLFLLMAQ